MNLFDIFLKLFEGDNITDVLKEMSEEQDCSKDEMIKEMLKIGIKL